ncbi:MAG: ABC transporter permease [Anaerolineales bacterium]|nr:ABC transporter permease [Anaerolineales bacterium]
MDKMKSEKQKSNLPGWVNALWQSAGIPLLAVMLALLIGAALLAISGASPLRAYSALLEGSFGRMEALGRTLAKATPLLFSGLAVAFAFKAGLFNIGAQGQLLFGALVSAAAGFMIKGLPPFLHASLALLAGATAGALFAAIPGALKAYTGAHEVITTIMLNYVAINITDYVADGPLKDTTNGNIVARTPEILDSARIPSLGQIPVGFFLAVIVAIIIWWLLWHTTLGFEIRTVGLNPHAAKYAGMRVALTVILTMVISGFLAGAGGAIETQGIVGRYQPGFNAGIGFDGITIAMLGKIHPFGIVPAALLIGAMKAGASQMQFDAHVAKEITDVIQALMLFFVTADMLIRKFLHVKTEDGEKVTISGWGQS